jgi:hypothetical protein
MLNDMPMSVCVGTVGEALEELRREKAEYIENSPDVDPEVLCFSIVDVPVVGKEEEDA